MEEAERAATALEDQQKRWREAERRKQTPTVSPSVRRLARGAKSGAAATAAALRPEATAETVVPYTWENGPYPLPTRQAGAVVTPTKHVCTSEEKSAVRSRQDATMAAWLSGRQQLEQRRKEVTRVKLLRVGLDKPRTSHKEKIAAQRAEEEMARREAYAAEQLLKGQAQVDAVLMLEIAMQAGEIQPLFDAINNMAALDPRPESSTILLERARRMMVDLQEVELRNKFVKILADTRVRISHIVRKWKLNDDSDGLVSLPEFKISIRKCEIREDLISDEELEKLFVHLDQEGTGKLTEKQLEQGLRNLVNPSSSRRGSSASKMSVIISQAQAAQIAAAAGSAPNSAPPSEPPSESSGRSGGPEHPLGLVRPKASVLVPDDITKGAKGHEVLRQRREVAQQFRKATLGAMKDQAQLDVKPPDYGVSPDL